MPEQNQALDQVLVVDDDPIICAIAEAHFKKRGARSVRTAADGAQALAILDESLKDPSFLLCDLNMPGMDGAEFLRHLEQRRFKGPIAIVSGEHESVIALAESLAHAHKLNIVGTLQKPMNADKLDQLLSRLGSKPAALKPETSGVFDLADLQAAISGGQITAYYQPKVQVRTGLVVGVEALARWRHPESGIILPQYFIKMAEKNGLMPGLTDAVLQNAIADVAHWRQLGIELSCSINLSVGLLNNTDLPDKISSSVDAAGVNRSQIILEITESNILKKTATTMEVMARLRLKGFELSIDDFGTGGASIETLRDFPFSELKIDKSYVSKMDVDEFALAGVRASVDLGKKLNLRLVAEGVETKNIADLIMQLGVDQIQGYEVGKPMSAEFFMQWLKEYQGLKKYQTYSEPPYSEPQARQAKSY